MDFSESICSFAKRDRLAAGGFRKDSGPAVNPDGFLRVCGADFLWGKTWQTLGWSTFLCVTSGFRNFCNIRLTLWLGVIPENWKKIIVQSNSIIVENSKIVDDLAATKDFYLIKIHNSRNSKIVELFFGEVARNLVFFQLFLPLQCLVFIFKCPSLHVLFSQNDNLMLFSIFDICWFLWLDQFESINLEARCLFRRDLGWLTTKS